MIEDRNPAWKKLFSGMELYAGAKIPTGYGIAWKCWDKDAYVIMPIPLNILTSWLRALWYGGIHGYTLDALAKANQAGYEEGRHDGLVQSQRKIERLVQEAATAARRAGYQEGWQAYGAAIIEKLDLERDEARKRNAD